MKKGREKKYILQHEQGHFDIAQIHARILRKRFEEIDWSRGRPDKSPQRVFDETFAECKAMQSQYDDETDHGTVDGEQSRWYQKIDHLLSEYKQYAE